MLIANTHTERILSRVEKLRALVPDACANHEWVNGEGYPKQLVGNQITPGGRILAVADAYAILDIPGDTERVLQHLRPLVGTQLDEVYYDALVSSLHDGVNVSLLRREGKRAGALSDRETEVLRHLAQGITNQRIAEALVISEKTVEHHLEHIYDKLGITSRTSAVVFAVQNGIAG